jgi:hypothetical protein
MSDNPSTVTHNKSKVMEEIHKQGYEIREHRFVSERADGAITNIYLLKRDKNEYTE